MRSPIHLHTLEHLEIKDSSERLNLFSGRAMSEVAFDKSQNYVADRIAPLLSGVWPGIQQGLEVEYLSQQAQQNTENSQRVNTSQLSKMAFASYAPCYPVNDSMPAYNQLKGRYKKELPQESDEANEEDLDALFKVQSGSAVTAIGTVVKLFTPLEVKWSDLLARSNLSLDDDLSGLYMLCLGRETIPVDYNESSACRRNEEDPVRDRRFETVGVLQLKKVSKDEFNYQTVDLIALNRHKTINRYLSQLVINPEQISLPADLATLGLLAIDEHNPIWFEAHGARFLSQGLAFPMALLAHTEQVFKELQITDKSIARQKTQRLGRQPTFIPSLARERRGLVDTATPTLTAIDRVDLMPSAAIIPTFDLATNFAGLITKIETNFVSEIKDTFQFLPAAGSLPSSLLTDVANIDAPHPKFAIDYPGLRVDMMPVPASGVAGILRRELGRGLIKFDSATKERMRLLIAVPDAEYHPKLLDVPVSEQALSVQLYDYGIKAYDTWANWRQQLELLFNSTTQQQSELGIPDIEGENFKSPVLAKDFFNTLIVNRKKTFEPNKALPPPYREGTPQHDKYDSWVGSRTLFPDINGKPAGLIVVYAAIEEDIKLRSNDLEQCNQFIDEISDLIQLQRQQLDVQSVSFAAFAGGVAGDGSGLQLTRWLPHVEELDITDVDDPADAVTTFTMMPMSVTANFVPATVTAAKSDTSNFQLDTSKMKWWGAASTADSPVVPSAMLSINSNKTTEAEVPFSSWTSNAVYNYQPEKQVTPQNYAAVTGLNDGIAKLSQLSFKSSPISAAGFKTADRYFGSLKHVSAILTESKNSHTAVTTLEEDSDALLEEIDLFIADVPAHIKLDIAATFKSTLITARIGLPSTELLVSDAQHYGHLFSIGKSLVKEISEIESARGKLIKLQKALKKYILQKQKELNTTDSEIVMAKNNLVQLDAIRREALDDYSAAQRLVIEHWQQVEEKFNQRNKTLNGMLGLYYVKVRETATSISLPNTQSLGYAETGDLVPGCRSDEQITLSDELDVFMDAVLDIPVAHWQALSTRIQQLPSRQRLMTMLERRKPRISSKQSYLSRNTYSRITGLSALRQQTLFVFNSFAERQFKTVHSLKHLQQEAAKVLSLEDLLNNSAGGRLRKPAQQLNNNIELACYCLLEKLNELLPSVRLVWAQLAEDDQLAIETPEKWPEIEKAEAADFNALRSCLELVRWFNRQLNQQADGDSRTALRNLIRACLMLAASDDPSDILEGQLQVAPVTLQPGGMLRLTLNQEAVPGAILQLLDKDKRTIAKLRLDDQDNEGASATIIKLFESPLEINTQQFMVIGHKYKNV